MTILKVILGITGSISAPKAQSIVSGLRQSGCEVRVAMTQSAARILAPPAITAVSEFKPFLNMWENPDEMGGEPHIHWAARADAMLIAPATASCLSDLRHGSYNSTVTLLAANFKPQQLFLAPAMSQLMWEQPAVQENVDQLRRWGMRFFGPTIGRVASGAQGQRLFEPRAIIESLLRELGSSQATP